MLKRVNDLHKKGNYIHRDINPSKFRIKLRKDKKNKIILIGFGLAERINDN